MSAADGRPWAFLVLTGLLVASAIFVSWRRGGAAAVPLIAAAIAFAFFSDSSSFDLFKFSLQAGFEARAARSAAVEARDATKALREVAVAASAAIVSMGGVVSNGGMALVLPAPVRDQNKQKLLELLKGMGASDTQILDVETADHDGVDSQYTFTIWAKVSSALYQLEKQDPSYRRDPQWEQKITSPDTTRKFVESLRIENRLEILDLVEDWDYYIKNKKQRRPEYWAKRDQWQN